MEREIPIVEIIGKESFKWLATQFNEQTALSDIPDDILKKVACVDITIRDYAGDHNSVTAIALITFAYKVANRIQKSASGAKDLTLLKVLAKSEMARREGKAGFKSSIWDAPLCDLIAGPVGDRIRAVPIINSPV